MVKRSQKASRHETIKDETMQDLLFETSDLRLEPQTKTSNFGLETETMSP